MWLCPLSRSRTTACSLTGARSWATGGPQRADTSFPKDRFVKLARRLTRMPDGFELQRQVAKTLAERDEMTEGERP